jgi:hypothetical protein
MLSMRHFFVIACSLVCVLALLGLAPGEAMLSLPGPAEGVALPAREICRGSWSPSGDRGEEPLHKKRNFKERFH